MWAVPQPGKGRLYGSLALDPQGSQLAVGGGSKTLSYSRASENRQDGSEPEIVWEAGAVTGGYPSPTFYRGQLFGLTNAAVVCLSAADGKEVWRQRVDGPFAGSPVIAAHSMLAER